MNISPTGMYALIATGDEGFHLPVGSPLHGIATLLFALSVLHTFLTKFFVKLSHRFPDGSIASGIFHFLGEVEVVFGLWAGLLILAIFLRHDATTAMSYLDSRNFTEPLFVFCIMATAATRPVVYFAGRVIGWAASWLPFPPTMGFYIAALVIGPLLGSFITEPAAMTVTALLLKEQFYDQRDQPPSRPLKYATLGLLFVNVSIGGTLTHFAAPPVLMVARPWGWDTLHMLEHFGYKAVTAVIVGTVITASLFRKELRTSLEVTRDSSELLAPRWWLVASHLFFLVLTVVGAHHSKFFLPLFLFFTGWVAVTQEYQDDLKLRESLLVAFFLGGLVTLGGMQGWWLQPLLTRLDDSALYLGATALTAVTDNAALTYLGTLVELGDASKYALVAGAVTGGGLTVIANAPNPAGYGILRGSFGPDGVSPLGLFLGALPYTLVALLCLWFLPSFHWRF